MATLRPPTAVDKHIAEVIKRERENLGLTLAELGRACGLGIAGIHGLEQARCRIYAGRLFLIAKALNVPIEEFFPKDDSNEQGLQPPP